MKKYLSGIPLGLLLCFVVGCQDKTALAELEQFKVQLATQEQNEETIRRFVEIFNSGDYEALKDFLAPDYAVYNPSGHPESTSREKLIEGYKGAGEAFSRFTWSIEDLIASKDKVICRIIASGTSKGGVTGLPQEPTDFKFSMITIMRLEAGKIVEEWQEDDQLGLARQLGMELKPKEAEK